MAIKFWSESDFFGKDDRQRHCERAALHWRLAMNCWFWLCGPGSTAPEWYREGSRKWHTPFEQDLAEKDRVLHGWTHDTLRAVKLANDGRRANKVFFGGGSPPPRKRSAARKTEYDPTLEDSPQSAAQSSAGALPPSIERDWPEKHDMTDDDRRKLRADVFSGRMPRRELNALRDVVAEVLYE